MTLQTMQWHERVTLQYSPDDYRRTSLIELVEPWVIGKRVLDMRCLTGHLAVSLAEKGFDVTGLDGCEEAVNMTNGLARKRGILKDIARQWDLTGLVNHVGANEFDTVLCLDILNHVPDDKIILRDISGALKPGGRLILVAPALPVLLGKRDRTMGHLRRYTKSNLIELIESNGMKIESIRFWNFIALPVYLLVERVFQREISDNFRYGRSEGRDSLLNRILRRWYKWVENKVHFPVGVTLVAIAERNGKLNP